MVLVARITEGPDKYGKAAPSRLFQAVNPKPTAYNLSRPSPRNAPRGRGPQHNGSGVYHRRGHARD